MSEEKVLFDPVSYVDRWKMEHEKVPTPSNAEMGTPVNSLQEEKPAEEPIMAEPEEVAEEEQNAEKESDQSVKDSRSKGQKTKKS